VWWLGASSLSFAQYKGRTPLRQYNKTVHSFAVLRALPFGQTLTRVCLEMGRRTKWTMR
jgi:hypothetical protein